MRKVKTFIEQYGPWALITGAAMGLGAEFARQLAGRGLNLVLVDIQRRTLEKISRELAKQCGVLVKTSVIDLAKPNFMNNLRPAIKNVEIGLLVNNAGLSNVGEFLDIPLEDHLRLVEVNVRAPLILTHEIGKGMVARGHGGIILLSSLSALQGTPLVANYAASKAYNQLLGESLWDELRNEGVDVLAFPPGATDTPGFRQDKPKITSGFYVMSAQQTVHEALGALGRQPSITPGWKNRFNFFLTGLLSRKQAIQIVGSQMRKMYKK